MDHGDHDIGVFAGHDFALLGDIHKTNQILDTEGRVRYCGYRSTESRRDK
jgi:hypothetical protein